MSVPRRTPPSISTGTRPATASTTSGRPPRSTPRRRRAAGRHGSRRRRRRPRLAREERVLMGQDPLHQHGQAARSAIASTSRQLTSCASTPPTASSGRRPSALPSARTMLGTWCGIRTPVRRSRSRRPERGIRRSAGRQRSSRRRPRRAARSSPRGRGRRTAGASAALRRAASAISGAAAVAIVERQKIVPALRCCTRGRALTVGMREPLVCHRRHEQGHRHALTQHVGLRRHSTDVDEHSRPHQGLPQAETLSSSDEQA